MTTTHYQRLGVEPRSSTEEIRRAYLREARAHHPDTAAAAEPGQTRRQQETMMAINEAWFVLSDPGRRRLYDARLEQLDPTPQAYRAAGNDEDWVPGESGYDWSEESETPPPEHTGGRSPAEAIAKLYAFVVAAIFILMAIAFGYAIVRSGLTL